jgi:hypothetical protein
MTLISGFAGYRGMGCEEDQGFEESENQLAATNKLVVRPIGRLDGPAGHARNQFLEARVQARIISQKGNQLCSSTTCQNATTPGLYVSNLSGDSGIPLEYTAWRS